MAGKTDDRQARIDELVSSVQQWSAKETEQIEQRLVLLRAVLTGRTGSDRLPAKAVAAASALVVDEIDSYLSF